MKNGKISEQSKFLFLLALLSAFPPLSIDLYLPAIPLLQRTWGQSAEVMNLTLVCFFLTYGLFLLVYGPLSDRFGRRPPLLAGVGLYCLASLLCALATGVTGLIIFRILQAAGAASASAIALAICKDRFEGFWRARILAYIGVITALAPMMAPVMGGWLLALAAWPWIFVLQSVIGLVAWLGVWRMPETLSQPLTTGAWRTAGVYIHLLGNPRFLSLVLLFGLAAAPLFAFIGGSSNIYIIGFGLSEQNFGYLFGANALALMAGSLGFTRLHGRVETALLLSVTLAAMTLGCAVMLGPWLTGPWRLALPIALVSLAHGFTRPPSNNLILEQVDRHAGAASSLMVFAFFMIGALAMWLISLDWADKISVIGLAGLVLCGGAALFWLAVPKRLFRFPESGREGGPGGR